MSIPGTSTSDGRSVLPAGASPIHWLDAGTPSPTSANGAGGAGRETPPIADLGGKAAALVRLLDAGLPVPPGFVILPGAFRFSAPGDAAGEASLTPGAAEDVRAAYAALGRRVGDDHPVVAVRSSAAAEDLPGASFAGQYTTYLGVRGADDVLRYAGHCAASLWSTPATAYRQQIVAAGKVLPEAAMAVVVQALVDAEAAGVAFTADPLAGAASDAGSDAGAAGVVIVNGAWGLGQSIVDGAVEGDTWRVDRGSLDVVREQIGLKATRTGATPDAPRIPVAADAQRRPCLTPEQVAAVARLALQAEALLGCPADVEWALAGDKLYLLQARPITALPASGAPGAPGTPGVPGLPGAADAPAPEPAVGTTPRFPFQWPEPEQAERHWRLEGGAGATPSLPWETDERASSGRAGQRAAALLGGERHRATIYLNGYRYSGEQSLPVSPEEREHRRTVFERPVTAIHDLGLTYWETVVFPEIDEGNRRLVPVKPDELSAPALAEHLAEALRWHERLWTLHSFALRTIRGPSNTLRQRFVDVYREVTGEADDTGVAPLLAFVPNKLSEAIDCLIDLARRVQGKDALRRLFETETAPVILDRLAETDGGPAFQQALGRVLETQGLRADAGAFTVHPGAQPGWAEQPALVITLVQRYVSQDLETLVQTHQAGVAERDRRVDALRATIADEETRRRFDLMLDGARREARAYEDHNYHIDAAAGALLHRALMATGRRLAGAGRLQAPEDVRWLHLHEIVAALQDLPEPVLPDAGEAAPGGSEPASTSGTDQGADQGADQVTDARHPRWDRLVSARQALAEWQRSLTPPPWVGAPPPPPSAPSGTSPQPAPGTQPSEAGAPARPAPPADVLVTGQPGSRGVATGRVRLVPRDTLVPDVAPGDVLVAYNAGALWTPVFPVAAAVVLDEGVLFQHAMLTCREYGVPGVFQAKQATQVLRDGQRVTVDGTNGWVLPAEEVEP